MSDTDWTHVLLVRHGEVEEQHRHTFYGGAEVPLSEAGEIASPLLAAKLVERYDPPDHIWCSPLSRTLAVAEPLAAIAGLEVQVDPGLLELDRGSWTHMTHQALEQQSPGAIAAYLADPENKNAPDGEKESVFTARVFAAFDKAVTAADGENLVVVTHGHVIRVLMRRYLDWDVPTSLENFIPYHGVVELRARPDGSGEIVDHPEGGKPLALQFVGG
jgi:broad specificity phosphatase PhoE